MDLFVVNRHTEDTQVRETPKEDLNLKRLLKKVEKRKKQRTEKKKKTVDLIEAIEKTKLRRQRKREQKNALQNKGTDTENENNFKDISIPEETPNENQVKPSEQNLLSDDHGFTILGGDKFERKAKIKRILPQWLSQPTVISVNLQNLDTKVSKIDELDKELKRKLRANNIKYLFPVQAVVIPWLLKENKNSNIIFPSDICVSAPTGSGKTLAFVLPIIQLLSGHLMKKIRALIILPTQDLAIQVFKTFQEYSKGTEIDACIITGHTSFQSEQNQLVNFTDAFGYSSKVDILVCTAGRLVDHLKATSGFDLSHLEFLVIDEADRLLDNVQNDWLYHLERHLQSNEKLGIRNILNLNILQRRRPPQKLLFSATLSQDPEKLQKLSLFQPKLFTSIVETNNEDASSNITQNQNTFIGKYTTPNELTEKYLICNSEIKPLMLFKLIQQEQLTKTIIFTHSLENVHRLVILLRSMLKSHRIEQISSNLQMQLRNKLIDKFSNNEIDLLVCTDAMARGMDLQGVKCVISYSAPRFPKTYIHRVGRTARAGESGLAVTLLHKSQLANFHSLLKQANKEHLEEIQIKEQDLQPYTELYQKALDDLRRQIKTQTETELKKLKSEKRPKQLKRRKEKSELEPTAIKKLKP